MSVVPTFSCQSTDFNYANLVWDKFVLTFVLFVFISVKTKKINARKEDSREWPKSIEGENHGDKTNVSGPNHR